MKIPKKHTPFTTPDGYLDTFSQDLKTRLTEEELGLPKKPGFTVPKDYFDTLPASITNKQNTTEPKVIALRSRKLYYLAAASIAAAFLVFFGLQWNGPEETSWDSIVNTDIENYFDANGLELSSYEIAEVISVDDLEVTDFLETEFQEEYLIEYLSERTDDFEDFNLEEDE